MPTDSYEMIRWVPFQRQKPTIGQPIIVFSATLGVVEAVLETHGLITNDADGNFTHWAGRIKGPSAKQLWIDRIMAWLPRF